MADVMSFLNFSSGEHQNVPNNFFRYFIVKRTDNHPNSSFKHTSPFLIHKSFQSLLGTVRNIKKLNSGDLLIEVFSASQSQTLSHCTQIGPFTVTVEAHKTLNTSRGVISVADLLYSTNSELLENLESQNVIEVRRINIRRNGQIIPTKHIILTFNSPNLPTKIKAAYLSCPVRPYIPNPLRCFQCQRYGHSKASCRGSITCAQCAEVGHESTSCNKPERCVNCNGNHASYSRSCPKWTFEKEVIAVRVNNNVSYSEARKIVESRTPSVSVSYSQITQSQRISTRDVSTQTHFSSAFPSSISTCSKGCSCNIQRLPTLKPLQTSSHPATIVHGDHSSQIPNLPITSSQTSSITSQDCPNIKKTISKRFSPKRTIDSNPHTSTQSHTSASNSNLPCNTVLPKDTPILRTPRFKKSMKAKQTTSPSDHPSAKFKGTKKQFIQYLQEVLEEEEQDNDTDYGDTDSEPDMTP